MKCEWKVGKDSGKNYLKVLTEEGWVTCFDQKDIDVIQRNINKVVSCEKTSSEFNGKTYYNIRNVEQGSAEENANYHATQEPSHGEVEKPVGKPADNQFFEKKPAVPKENSWDLREYEKCPVGLSVEIFLNLLDDKRYENTGVLKIMEDSAILVKQARKEFS